jgi:hypothetical protein
MTTARQKSEVLADALRDLGFEVKVGMERQAHKLVFYDPREPVAYREGGTVYVDDDGFIRVDSESEAGLVNKILRKIGWGTEAIEIEIPDMPEWQQVGGDMDPAQYGGTIAKCKHGSIELLRIMPVREYVGDRDAAEVGFPFWTKEAYFDLDDLYPGRGDVRSALNTVGMNLDTLKRDFTPTERAIVIAEALLDYGRGDPGPSGWSNDILSEKVRWWSGEVAGPEYLSGEDEEFRREVLGEDEEEEDEEDEADEDEER